MANTEEQHNDLPQQQQQQVELLDPHSFAVAGQPKTTRVDLDLDVDFASRTIKGTATLSLDRKATGALDLDTRDLTIEQVRTPSGESVTFEVDPAHPVKGSRLRLALDGTDSVSIGFTTSPSASALQWLEPAQTAGGVHPYVFSQCQAIHARSIFPCQDTPSVRIKYSAKLRIPSSLRAVMSAKHVAREEAEQHSEGREDSVVEVFAMEQPIPPYLFALAVGDIAHETISPRVKVYAEPSIVKAAATEFSDIEQMVVAAESLFGPYVWDEFNVLVMPPSFPYGGMENPRCAFLTPTLLVGDKSLVNVVAHELAHSWTGNLVTNSTYADFWLNEGWTVYAERRILEALEGAGPVRLHESIGRVELSDAIAEFEAKGKRRMTQLDVGCEGLEDVDPDEVFSTVPYEKGFSFLKRIEQVVGREAFDKFIAAYIAAFSFQPIDTRTFLAFLTSHFPDLPSLVDLQTWTKGQGLPPDTPSVHSDRLTAIKAAAAAVAAANEVDTTGGSQGAVVGLAEALPSAEVVRDWGSTEWEVFLRSLPKKLSHNTLLALDSKFRFSESRNRELSCAFLATAVRSSLETYVPAVEALLLSVGRMKYLRPLYSALLEGGFVDNAKRIFATAKPKYHPVAQSVITGVLCSS